MQKSVKKILLNPLKALPCSQFSALKKAPLFEKERELSQLVQCSRKGEKFMIYVHHENSHWNAFDVLLLSIMKFIYEVLFRVVKLK